MSQESINNAVLTDIENGEAHVYYGLIAITALTILSIIFKKYLLWFCIAILMIVSAIFADLWAHGYTH